MKRILSAFIVIAGIFLIPSGSHSQEQEGCFMLDRNGKPIDLSRVCGNTPRVNSSSEQFKIPIKRRSGGVPVIDVKFNGKQTFEMLLDTGASSVVLTSEMAKALKVKQEGVITVSTASENQVKFPTGRVASVQVGGIVVKGMVVAISPSLELGLLGQSFFGNHDVTIKEKVIEIRPRQ